VQIYRTKPEHDTDGSDEHPILLSYLDTVVQGYLTEFGEDGARRFFETTAGWEAPVFDDRAEPVYSRVTRLTDDERTFVDDELRLRGVRRITRPLTGPSGGDAEAEVRAPAAGRHRRAGP
jgi:hypothetical protein